MDTVHDRFTAYVQVSAVTLIQHDREETGGRTLSGTSDAHRSTTHACAPSTRVRRSLQPGLSQLRACAVETLDIGRALVTEWGGRTDGLPIAVRGESDDGLVPLGAIPAIHGRFPEAPYPSGRGANGLVGEVSGALLAEVAAFVEVLSHVGRHRAEGLGDESDDEARSWRSPAAVPAGRKCKAVVQDCRDVVGVVQPVSGHGSREQSLNRVAVGFCTS